MEIRNLRVMVILLSIVQGLSFGGEPLDNNDIQLIFQTLTAQPRKTWISTGTIEAKHLAYEASKGYTTESNVIVKYDGERFYWEIDVDSYAKQVEPQDSSNGEPSSDDFDLKHNKKRVFVWDGECYTMYFETGNCAIVTENPHDTPVVVNGPLTAGVVPWGYGICTLENLLAAESSGEIDSLGHVNLIVHQTNSPKMVFTLDPAKNYAILSSSINNPGRSSVVTTCGDYKELTPGKWIPTTILVERYNCSEQTPELITSDYWEIDSISATSPQADAFRAGYETGAFVEYYSPFTDEPLSYHHSNEVDIDSLLYDRLLIATTGGTQSQSCARAAMKYVLAQLGKGVSAPQLAELANEPNEGVNLYELRKFGRELGLHCRAIKTDVKTLRHLKGYQVILHLPKPNHYVVLEHIDNEYLWVIDLVDNKFYYRIKPGQFGLDWSNVTVLLISEDILDLEGNFTELSNDQLHKIIGGFPKYSCTDLIQAYDVIFCSQICGICDGVYRTYYNRYGCIEDEDGGYCFGDAMVGNASTPCIEDPYNPGSCIGNGDWYAQYIRACK